MQVDAMPQNPSLTKNAGKSTLDTLKRPWIVRSTNNPVRIEAGACAWEGGGVVVDRRCFQA
jgi:hypothetical protein